MPDQPVDFPSELYGAPLERARTLPGRWYADPEHHAREVLAVFHRRWIGVACADEVAVPGSYVSTSVAGVPVLVTRDAGGTLRAFLNGCRHRGSPLADGCGQARALSCPYHGWVYRLDGTLARAGGVGHPVGFGMADFGLRSVQVTTFARSVLVNLDPEAAAFDPGPLAAGRVKPLAASTYCPFRRFSLHVCVVPAAASVGRLRTAAMVIFHWNAFMTIAPDVGPVNVRPRVGQTRRLSAHKADAVAAQLPPLD